MLLSKDIKLLKSLISIPSPSGFEKTLANSIRQTLLQYLPRTRVEIDFHNNVIATIKGKSDKVIMIDAHSDQLGFLVNNVDRQGYISLIPIGGHDISLLRGRKVIILSDKGKVNGVIGTKPIHLIDDEKEEIPEKTTDLTLDIGIRRRRQVLRYIKIGDPVILQPEFSQLIDDYYTGSGFDDKAGCFLLIQTIKQIINSKRKPIPTLKFVFSSQEEIGCRGAREVVRRENPSIFIGVDVTFATDQYEVNERETGKCQLGRGLAIYKGVNIYRPAVALLESTARRKKIKIQYLATTGTGTNAGYVANTLGGIKVIDLAIPLRYMHSNVEVINMKDIRTGVKLLKSFLLNRRLGRIIQK